MDPLAYTVFWEKGFTSLVLDSVLDKDEAESEKAVFLGEWSQLLRRTLEGGRPVALYSFSQFDPQVLNEEGF